MEEMTDEQKKAIAIASARLRLKQQTTKQMVQQSQNTQSYYDPLSGASAQELAKYGKPLQPIARILQLASDPYELGGLVSEKTGSPGLGFAANVALSAVGARGGGVGLRNAASYALNPASEKLYISALNPTTKQLEKGDVPAIARRLMQEGINVSRGGALKLMNIMRPWATQLKNAIDTATAAGKKVSTLDVGSEFNKLLFSRDVRMSTSLPEYRKTILNEWDKFFRGEQVKMATEIPVAKAQEMKQAVQAELSKKEAFFRESDEGPIREQALKALEEGLRKSIEKEVPAVIEPNNNLHELMGGLEMVDKESWRGLRQKPGALVWLIERPTNAIWYVGERNPIMLSAGARGLKSKFLSEAISSPLSTAGIAEYNVAQQNQ